MLAMINEATVGPAGVDAAARAVRREVLRFLEQPGAVEGHWMVDRSTGRLLTVTIWTSPADTAVGPGRVASVVGLRPAAVSPQARLWARVTRVEGVVDTRRSALEAAHRQAVLDQSRSEGFRGSCWLGAEDTGEGLALSLWDGPPALIRGEHDSRRRREELTLRFGARVTGVAELECLGGAVAQGAPTHPGDAPP